MISTLLFALLSPVANAQDAEPQPAEEITLEQTETEESDGMQPEMWTLEDGTQVVLVSDHRVPLVQLNLVLPAGSWSPWMQANHGSEAWRIQIHDEAGELSRRADALAARISLNVTKYSSELSVTCLKEDLPQVLELVDDVLTGRDFMKDELKRWNKERKIDWQGNLKDTGFRLNQAANSLFFETDDPRNRAWTERPSLSFDVDALAQTRDSILRLPGRMIGLAGDLERDEAEALVQGLLPVQGEAPSDLPFGFQPIKAERPDRLDEEMSNLTQVYLSHSATAPSWDDPLYPAFELAQHVLGGHFHSRLYIALRHEDGDTYGAGSRAYIYAETGRLSLTTFTRLDNAEEIEAKLIATLQTFHDEGITQEELDNAVRNFEGGMRFDNQSPGQVMDRVLWEMSTGKGQGHENRMLEASKAMSLDEVNAAIRELYDPQNFTMVRLVPEP